MAQPPSDHNSDNSSCDCSMCCGRGDWAWPRDHNSDNSYCDCARCSRRGDWDPVDALLERLESENRRLQTHIRWLQDQLQESRRLVAQRDDELALAHRDSQQGAGAAPRHANWLASFRVELPELPQLPSAPCAWHDEADVYNNVAVLPCVVGMYNRISSVDALDSLFTHLEVTLFGSDSFGWPLLQNKMRSLLQAQQIVILVGRPKKNKWIHVNCVNCGKSVFVKYDMAGSCSAVTPEDHEQRRRLFQFVDALAAR